MPNRTMLSVQATPDVASIRTATLFEEEHTVIPCVALVEGVLWPANAPAPELALAEEFGRFPDGWNGRPVVFDHPKVNGMAVSASHPDVMEDVAFGSIFNTTVEDGKLKCEIWINNVRVELMGDDVKDAVSRLEDGDETVEVSTGLFTMSEEVEGKFDGEEFSAIWRNIVPDHLAVLPEGIKGACSVEDGCGAPRTNTEFTPIMNSSRIEFTNQTDTTFQTFQQGCAECQGACECETEKKGIFQRLMEKAGDLFSFQNNAENMSDNDVRTAVSSALSTQESFFWIMAVFDAGNGSGTVVFESFDSGKLFEQEFTISESSVTLGAEKVEVRPVTQFVPVTIETSEPETNSAINLQENSTMNKDQLVQGLIDNASAQFTEDDRDWLNTLEESQLAKLSPVTNEEEVTTEEEVTEEVTDEVEEVSSIGTVIGNAEVTPAPVTTEDYIKNAPADIQAVLNSGVDMHRRRKKAIIDGLVANARCTFTADQLGAKPLDELEQIAALSGDVTFEANAPLRANAEDSNAAPSAPQLFDLTAKSA